MAKRPIFIPSQTTNLVDEINVEFEWFPGFAVSQKQKSIAAFHDAAKELGLCKRPLEISSKSEVQLGVDLSAFNLKVALADGRLTSLENIFQAAKIFENGGPHLDLLDTTPLEAKRDPRLKESGDLRAFRGKTREWPIEPKTVFYDWIYANAVLQNPDLLSGLLEYDAFTDIEFNPAKSFNCQARSAALIVYLSRNGKLSALENEETFLSLYADNESDSGKDLSVQKFLI